MKVSCPSCAAKYSIADEKVRNRLAKIRCRKCETTIVIDGKTDPPTIHAADAGAARSDEYTVDISDNDQRQMTVAQVVAAYNEGLVTAETYVWKDGMADWEPLANVPELSDALHRAAAEAAASMAPAVSVPPSASFSTAAATGAGRDLFGAAQAASSHVPRAATRGGGADLFGSIDRAGGETDLATSAHDPLPVQPSTGARNESSVLFSLSALTGSEKVKPPLPVSRDTGDDSGLIDLGALAAKSDTGASHVAAASPLGMAGVSPLGAPLIGGSTSALGADGAPVRAPGPSRNGLYIGGGIAFAALVAGVVILLKEPPPPAPGVIAIATAIPTAPAEVAAPDEKKDEPEGDEKAEGKDDDKKEGASTPKTGGRRYVPSGKSSAKSDSKPAETKSEPKSESKSDKPPEEKKPKKSSCNCKPGDLMCAMKCSAK